MVQLQRKKQRKALGGLECQLLKSELLGGFPPECTTYMAKAPQA